MSDSFFNKCKLNVCRNLNKKYKSQNSKKLILINLYVNQLVMNIVEMWFEMIMGKKKQKSKLLSFFNETQLIYQLNIEQNRTNFQS